MGPNQAAWNKRVQRRVAVTSSSLKSMKGLKLMGLTDVVTEHLQRLRVEELELCKVFMRLIAWLNTNCKYYLTAICSDLYSVSSSNCCATIFSFVMIPPCKLKRI